MSKIKVRNYKTCYDLTILPALIPPGHLPYETGPEKDTRRFHRFVSILLDKLELPSDNARYFKNKVKHLEATGGVIASLAVSRTDMNGFTGRSENTEIDLGYCVTKELQIFIGGINITPQLNRSPLLMCVLEKILHELYNYHEKYYICSREGENFIEELFLMDDVDVVVSANSGIEVNIDSSLRNYLVSLNERLRISA